MEVGVQKRPLWGLLVVSDGFISLREKPGSLKYLNLLHHTGIQVYKDKGSFAKAVWYFTHMHSCMHSFTLIGMCILAFDAILIPKRVRDPGGCIYSGLLQL